MLASRAEDFVLASGCLIFIAGLFLLPFRAHIANDRVIPELYRLGATLAIAALTTKTLHFALWLVLLLLSGAAGGLQDVVITATAG